MIVEAWEKRMIGNSKAHSIRSNRISHALYMFEAFTRQHGRKPSMRELVKFAIAEVKDDRREGYGASC
jgi:hypothetical protein